LKGLRTGLIDPDTPDSVMSRTAADGTKQVLVFSDEFNKDGRTFYDGDDPFFQAVDIWYGATQDLEVNIDSFNARWQKLTDGSGTTQTQHPRKTAPSTSSLIVSITMAWRIALV
jgi:beta-glucanase (GH16 family)